MTEVYSRVEMIIGVLGVDVVVVDVVVVVELVGQTPANISSIQSTLSITTTAISINFGL